MITYKNGDSPSIDEFEKISISHIGIDDIREVEPQHIINYLVFAKIDRSNETTTRMRKLSSLKSFFSYAYSVEDARAEAQAFLTLLDGKRFEYPVFLDIEHSPQKIAEMGMTREDITDICVEFISTLQKNGYYAALYTNEDWLTNYLDRAEITALFDVWYARYASSTDTVVDAVWNTNAFGQQMGLWQFSQTGIIEGIYYKYQKEENGSAKAVLFDMNYAYKDYPALIRRFGLNGYGEATPLPAR
jgi:hypothetical protein